MDGKKKGAKRRVAGTKPAQRGFPASLVKQARRDARARALGQPISHERKPRASDERQQSPADENAYVRPGQLSVEGATSPAKVAWIRTTESASGREVWIPKSDFEGGGRLAKARLKQAGIVLFDEDLKAWIEQARKVEHFPPRPLLDRPGWTVPYFGALSGEVFSPKDEGDEVVLFDTHPDKWTRKGRLKDWKWGVARLAADQPIITFLLMLAFVGALLRVSRLRFNFGVELVGPSGVEKAPLLQLVSSIFGGAVEPEGRNCWVSATTTMDALEDSIPQHADGCLVIEDISLFCAGTTERDRGGKFADLMFRLISGTVNRPRGEHPQPVRLVFLTASDEPLSALLRHGQSRTSAVAADRLLSIPIPPDAEHGIFTNLPEGCNNEEEAVRAIVSLITDHHGWAMRRFLEQLVKELAADEVGFKKRLEATVDKFRAAAGVRGNVGSDPLVGNEVGLVYAAGRLAKRYGALPPELKCLRAAKACYQLNRQVSGPPPSPAQELRALAMRKGVIVIDPNNLKKISDREIAAAPAILRKLSEDRIELLLTKEALKRAFPQWRSMLKDPMVFAVTRRDNDKPTVKRTVRKNKKQERFYCFALSSGE